MKAFAKRLRALHSDEQGADMVEYILIVAAIALPVLGVVIWFWKDISSWAREQWDSARSSAEEGTEDFD